MIQRLETEGGIFMFLQNYKRLDNLCKDIFQKERGISSYIEEMERCGYLSKEIAGWKNDYKNLKKYRFMRNRIVHENNVDETTLCTDADEMWLERFYERIIQRNDPLALYRQKREEKKVTPSMSTLERSKMASSVFEPKRNNQIEIWLSIGMIVIFLILIAIMVYILS